MHSILEGQAALNVRTVQRQLAALLPEARPAGTGDNTLEIAGQGMDAPRLISATLLEQGLQRAHPATGPAAPGFRAFLDGTQRSEIASYLGGAPIVLGRAAAVVRERRDRRMCTWGAPLVETRMYCPRSLVTTRAWKTLETAYGDTLVDTSDGGADLTEAFLQLVKGAAERAGHALTGVGELQRISGTLGELDAAERLEATDLAADRAVSDAQLVGGQAHLAQACEGLERP